MIQTILTTGNTKILKGEKLGYLTKGIHFSPADKSGHEVCNWRSKGCTKVCLDMAGRGQMQPIQDARIKKTKRFFEDSNEDVIVSLMRCVRYHSKLSLIRKGEPFVDTQITRRIHSSNIICSIL